MNDNFVKINPKELNGNVFYMLDNQWMLITGGTLGNANTMTASWGGMGVLWNKSVVYVVVRPQRHTFSFLQHNDHFSLSFFAPEYKNVLDFCGANSGRNIDKIKECKLTAQKLPSGAVGFNEASILFDCRKLYVEQLNPNSFIDKSIADKVYPGNDFHYLYVAEITGCYVKK